MSKGNWVVESVYSNDDKCIPSQKSKKERKQWKIKREKLVERSREAIY